MAKARYGVSWLRSPRHPLPPANGAPRAQPQRPSASSLPGSAPACLQLPAPAPCKASPGLPNLLGSQKSLALCSPPAPCSTWAPCPMQGFALCARPTLPRSSPGLQPPPLWMQTVPGLSTMCPELPRLLVLQGQPVSGTRGPAGGRDQPPAQGAGAGQRGQDNGTPCPVPALPRMEKGSSFPKSGVR